MDYIADFIDSNLLAPSNGKPQHKTWAMLREAHKNKELADDIVAEQQKLDAADLVILQFPFEWYSFPTIIKGWLDRVMVPGYAFNYWPDLRLFETGRFAVRKH